MIMCLHTFANIYKLFFHKVIQAEPREHLSSTTQHREKDNLLLLEKNTKQVLKATTCPQDIKIKALTHTRKNV